MSDINTEYKIFSAETHNQTPIANAVKLSRADLAKKIKNMRDRDRELVRGKFIFHEVPGGTMSFPFKAYKEDPLERYDLVDGEVYTIPLGVARHLNKNCWYPVHAYALDERGKPAMKIGQKVRRCSFQSLEFIDADDLTPVGSGVLTAETVISSVSI
jgi:hypothetical protein